MISNTPTLSSPATVFTTPIAKRPRANAHAPQFNPQAVRVDYVHKVALTITPSINGEPKPAVLKTIDVNEFLVDSLQAHVYSKRIELWEQIWSLKKHELCQIQYWMVTIGNIKGHHSVIQAEDEREWDDCIATLRQMEHSRDRKKYYQLTIEAVYKSHGIRRSRATPTTSALWPSHPTASRSSLELGTRQCCSGTPLRARRCRRLRGTPTMSAL